MLEGLAALCKQSLRCGLTGAAPTRGRSLRQQANTCTFILGRASRAQEADVHCQYLLFLSGGPLSDGRTPLHRDENEQPQLQQPPPPVADDPADTRPAKVAKTGDRPQAAARHQQVACVGCMQSCCCGTHLHAMPERDRGNPNETCPSPPLAQTEQRRRDRINTGFEALRELLPSCEKADKAAFLMSAAGYIRQLQARCHYLFGGPASSMSTACLHAQVHLQARHTAITASVRACVPCACVRCT